MLPEVRGVPGHLNAAYSGLLGTWIPGILPLSVYAKYQQTRDLECSSCYSVDPGSRSLLEVAAIAWLPKLFVSASVALDFECTILISSLIVVLYRHSCYVQLLQMAIESAAVEDEVLFSESRTRSSNP